jgi:hypothetical protein
MSDYIGNRREMQDSKSFPFGSPIGQNEPTGVQEQLASSHFPYNRCQSLGNKTMITSVALKSAVFMLVYEKTGKNG